MRIEFTIDELVLTGFDPRERHRIADAVERELAARISAAHVLPLARGGEAVPVLRETAGTPRPLTADASPRAIGAAVATSIARLLAPAPLGAAAPAARPETWR